MSSITSEYTRSREDCQKIVKSNDFYKSQGMKDFNLNNYKKINNNIIEKIENINFKNIDNYTYLDNSNSISKNNILENIKIDNYLNNNSFDFSKYIFLDKPFKEINVIDTISSKYSKYYSNNIIDKNIKPKNSILYNNKLLNIGLYKNTLFMEPSSVVTPENIAEFAYPIVQFVKQEKPDFIVSCDRGGRMLGLAVKLLYLELYGELPTLDHQLHFRKISKSILEDDTRKHLKPLVERFLQKSNSPRILVLDDWVFSGSTKELVERMFIELTEGRSKTLFGVMRGLGADITGSNDSNVKADCHDNESKIGVKYEKDEKTDTLIGHQIGSSEAREYRDRMIRSIKDFAKQIKENSTSDDRRGKDKRPQE